MVRSDGVTQIEEIVAAQEQFFKSGRTRDLDFRLENLNRLKKAVINNEDACQVHL